jgi:uncharacterized integral membrane protein
MMNRFLITFSIFVLLIVKDGVNSFIPSSNISSNDIVVSRSNPNPNPNPNQHQNVNVDRQIIFNSRITRHSVSVSKSNSRIHNIHSQISLQSSLNSDSEDNTRTSTISTKEKINVVLFRISLVAISIAYSLNQITDIFQGSGLPMDTLTNIEQSSNAIFGWGILVTAFIIPNYRGSIDKTFDEDTTNIDNSNSDDYDSTRTDGTDGNVNNNEEDTGNDSLSVILNNALPILSSVTILFKLVSTIVSGNINEAANLESISTASISSNMDQELFISGIFIIAICAREIGYFGAGFKAEAILAIILVSTSLTGLNDIIGIPDAVVSSVLALCLLVLSVGKVFEPLEDDIRPNGSLFFGENQE